MQEVNNEINIKNLLVSGAHFGSRTSNWHPKSKPYIYGIRNGVYIIDLENTLEMWSTAREFIVSSVASGGEVLFVGTKHTIKDIIKAEAERCDALYVNDRWLGGTLTNFQVIAKSLEKLKNLEDFIFKAEQAEGGIKVTKLELIKMHREVEKLNKSLGGLRKLKFVITPEGKVKVNLPKVIFITNTHKEYLAVQEAKRLCIPIVALTNTTTNPEKVDYPIPTNDESTKSLALFTRAIADAILEGKELKSLKGLTPSAEAVEQPFLQEVTAEQIEGEKERKEKKSRSKDKELVVEKKRTRN